MTILSLRPSEIRYTQDSIGNTFGRSTRHRNQYIGQTLDEFLTGTCSVYDIPTLSVLRQDGNYYTADNRRLWVFQKAEEFGRCDNIPVMDGAYLPPIKWTTINDGESLYVRGDPGGRYWKTLTPTPKRKGMQYIEDITESENIANISIESNDDINGSVVIVIENESSKANDKTQTKPSIETALSDQICCCIPCELLKYACIAFIVLCIIFYIV